MVFDFQKNIRFQQSLNRTTYGEGSSQKEKKIYENSESFMKIVMETEEILKYLPQRPPFLLVDRIVEFESGKSIIAIKNVTINEPFFVGHFPEKPIMPGVLILEALAQASTILAFKSTGENPKSGQALYFFAGIDRVRFKRVVLPGDQLRLEVRLVKARESIWKLDCEASVDNQIVCTAQIMSVKKQLQKSTT